MTRQPSYWTLAHDGGHPTHPNPPTFRQSVHSGFSSPPRQFLSPRKIVFAPFFSIFPPGIPILFYPRFKPSSLSFSIARGFPFLSRTGLHRRQPLFFPRLGLTTLIFQTSLKSACCASSLFDSANPFLRKSSTNTVTLCFLFQIRNAFSFYPFCADPSSCTRASDSLHFPAPRLSREILAPFLFSLPPPFLRPPFLNNRACLTPLRRFYRKNKNRSSPSPLLSSRSIVPSPFPPNE